MNFTKQQIRLIQEAVMLTLEGLIDEDDFSKEETAGSKSEWLALARKLKIQ